MERTHRERKYYKDREVANEYDRKRFSFEGGRYIYEVEKDVFLQLLGDIEGKRILDVATGTGRLALHMAEKGAEVTAVDISPQMLEEAERKAERRDLDIDFMVADAEDLGFSDEEFDIVTSSRFMHLNRRQDHLVSEMHRIAREKIVYDFFNRYSLRCFYEWALPMNSYLHGPERTKEMLEAMGLDEINMERRFFLPYGIFRNKGGLPIRFAIETDRFLSQETPLGKFSSAVYVSAEL